MKYSMVILLVCFMLACNDDELNDIDVGKTVFGLATRTQGSASKFYYQDQTPIEVDFRWRSQEAKYDVYRIEFYIRFDEPYIDRAGNLMLAKHGGEKGMLFKTLEGVAVPVENNPVTISISQKDIYELFKDASFDYDGDQSLTSVFNNPAQPGRVPEGYIVEGDEFRLSWILTTKDGLVVGGWPASTCVGSKDSNCSFDWVAACALDVDLFTGSYTCDEPGYMAYQVNFSKSQASPDGIVNHNFWDVGATVTYYISSVSKEVTIPLQPFNLDGISYRVSGKGQVDTCTGDMDIEYVITNSKGTVRIEENVHRYKKSGD